MSDDKTNSEPSTIQKIQSLKDLLGISVPMDEQLQYGEGTKYIPVFDANERQTIKTKIMSLVKAL